MELRNNQPKLYTLIRFTSVTRRTRIATPQYVATVSWADGPGWKVKSVGFTTDRSKAFRFSLLAAHAVAEQYVDSVIAFERPDGTPMPEETEKLRAVQLARLKEHAARVAEANRELAEVFGPVLPLLLKGVQR
jgi:hypothetical protein